MKRVGGEKAKRDSRERERDVRDRGVVVFFFFILIFFIDKISILGPDENFRRQISLSRFGNLLIVSHHSKWGIY